MMLMIFQRGQQRKRERGNTSCSISPKALIVLNREFRTSVRSFRVIEIVSLLSLPDCHSSCNSGTDPNNHYSLASLWLGSNLRPFPPAEKTNCFCWPVVYFSIPNPPRTYNNHKNHDNIRRRLVFSLGRSHLSSTLWHLIIQTKEGKSRELSLFDFLVGSLTDALRSKEFCDLSKQKDFFFEFYICD